MTAKKSQTSSKTTIESLQKKVAEADALAEMKGNFLATMSHEIRTPMQTIYGLLELIVDEKPGQAVTTMANTAQQAASGLLEILDDILDLAKMDADKMELDIYEVPVRTLVRGILEALSVKVHSVDIDLIDDIGTDVPFVIVGDPKRLRQIIMNLTGNALKFTEKGTVTVKVSTQTRHIKTSIDKIGLRFEVIDTGIGMSKEVCDKLFSNFTQADSSTQRKYGGTGLGLSISKKLVDLMEGQIGVESKVGKGSTFWFEIPTTEISTDTTPEDLPDLDGISILSVEDHPQGAREILKSLRSMGAYVESCSTYTEGLALAKRRPFDVAVIDQGLPDGLGIDLIKEIAKLRPNMGMVMYTVRDDVGLSHSLQALGVKYLTKPASRAGLGQAVKDCARNTHNIEKIEGPNKLLIAEDTESVRYVLKMQLDKLNINYEFAQNGREAYEKLETGKFGILISDLHMPEIDGYALVEKIRERDKKDGTHFPVIVLTADVQMAQRETYMRYGFDECLLKPVSMGQFKRLMIRWGLMNEKEKPAEESENNKSATQQSAKSIDIDTIKSQMGDFGENEIQMLKMFTDMTYPLIENLEEAYTNKDIHQISEISHSLKGAALSACCIKLGEIAGNIQDKAEQNQKDEKDLEEIKAEFENVKTEINQL